MKKIKTLTAVILFLFIAIGPIIQPPIWASLSGLAAFLMCIK